LHSIMFCNVSVVFFLRLDNNLGDSELDEIAPILPLCIQIQILNVSSESKIS
jgi:hypothetical protein